jgi:hypothetical protein
VQIRKRETPNANKMSNIDIIDVKILAVLPVDIGSNIKAFASKRKIAVIFQSEFKPFKKFVLNGRK